MSKRFTFIRLKLKTPRMSKALKYHYLLKITSEEDLTNYIERYHDKRTQDAIADIIGNISGKYDHSSNRLAGVVGSMAKLSGKSAVCALSDLSVDTVEGMFRAFRDTGTVYVNNNGGYMIPCRGLSEVEPSITNDTGNWPLTEKPDVNYLKWPGGVHWYAKIEGVDVVVDGEQKWNTKKAAQAAVESYLEDEDES